MENHGLLEVEFEYLVRTEVVLDKYQSMCETPLLQLNKQTLDTLFFELDHTLVSLQKKFPKRDFENSTVARICESYRQSKTYRGAEVNNNTIIFFIGEIRDELRPLKGLLSSF